MFMMNYRVGEIGAYFGTYRRETGAMEPNQEILLDAEAKVAWLSSYGCQLQGTLANWWS